MSLQVNDLTVSYGAIEAVRGLSFSLSAGQALALLGPNGAGKTSSVEAIVSLIPKRSGVVLLDGYDVSTKPCSTIADRGLALVPQSRDLFPHFSIEENLLAGATAARKRVAKPLEYVFDLFPILHDRRRDAAGSLSGGQQQMLAIGRALVGAPKFLLLDEPSTGLSEGIIRTVIDVVNRIRSDGIGILLVEQRLEIAEAVAEECIVLAVGDVVWQGSMVSAMDAGVVREAFFG